MNELAILYENGNRVGQNFTEAVRWYRNAANKGDKYAQYNLGRMYQYAKGVSKDLSMAKVWYEKSANLRI